MNDFFQCSREHEVSRQVDIAWVVFLRVCSKKLFDINFERTDNQKMLGWTVLHAMISHGVRGPTNIGYCQAIAADCKTVYTVLKRAESMFQR